MVEHARKELAREHVRGFGGPGLDDARDAAAPDDGHHALAADLAAYVERLPESQRWIMQALEGYGVKQQTPEAIARVLRVEEDHVTRLRQTVRNQLRDLLEAGKKNGRPPEAYVRAVVGLSRRLRSQGKSWEEVAAVVHEQLGRRYTATGLRSLVWKRGGKKDVSKPI